MQYMVPACGHLSAKKQSNTFSALQDSNTFNLNLFSN